MKPDREKRLHPYALLKKERLKRPDHHAVVEKHQSRANPGKQSGNKHPKRDIDIIRRNSQKHSQFTLTAIDGHRFAAADVVERHIDVVVAHNQTHECIVVKGRERSDQHTAQEYQKRIEQFAARLVHYERKLLFPKEQYTRPFLFLVFIQRIVKRRCQIVQISRNTRPWIMAARERKIGRDFGIRVGKAPRVLRVGGCYHLFQTFPLGDVLPYKRNLFQLLTVYC